MTHDAFDVDAARARNLHYFDPLLNAACDEVERLRAILATEAAWLQQRSNELEAMSGEAG